MKKWTRILAIVLALGMLLALTGCGAKKADPLVRQLVDEDAMALVRKDFDSDQAYYRAVEQRRADEVLGLAMAGRSLDMNAGDPFYLGGKLLLTLDQSALEQELLDLVTESLGMDLSWLKSLGLNVNMGRSGELSQMDLAVQLNETDIITAQVVMDRSSMTEYVRVPELNDAAASVSLTEMGLPADPAEMGQLMADYSANPVTLETLQRYYDIVMENVQDVSLAEGSVTAGDLTSKCTVATVSLQGQDMLNMAKTVLDAAENDEQVRGLAYYAMRVSGEFEGSAEDFEETYQAKIDELRQNLAETKPEDVSAALEMTVYIDEKGEILGRHAELKQDGETKFLYAPLTARDGDKLGVDLQIGVRDGNSYEWGDQTRSWEDYTLVSLQGNGSFSADTGAISGDFLLHMAVNSDYNGEKTENEHDIFQVKVNGKVGPGGFLGELELIPTQEILDLACEELEGAPESVLRLVRSLSLYASNQGTGNNLDFRYVLRTDGKDLLTMSLTGSPIDAFEISVPTDTVDMETWSSGIGFGALSNLMNNLRNAGVPSSVFNGLLG